MIDELPEPWTMVAHVGEVERRETVICYDYSDSNGRGFALFSRPIPHDGHYQWCPYSDRFSSSDKAHAHVRKMKERLLILETTKLSGFGRF